MNRTNTLLNSESTPMKLSDLEEEAKKIILFYTWRSFSFIEDDGNLPPYLSELVKSIANLYGKEVKQLSISDAKRLIDFTFSWFKRLGIDELTLDRLGSIRSLLEVGSDISKLYSFCNALAGLVVGEFGWLSWHIAKNISGPRLKRAVIVYLTGQLALVLYGKNSEISDLGNDVYILDPILASMDRPTIEALCKLLDIKAEATLTDRELCTIVSERLASEGKDQGIRSLFPKDAESYLEVLIVVAKRQGIDVRGYTDVAQIEAAICNCAFREMWEKLSADQKAKVAEKWQEEGGKYTPNSAAALAGLGAIGIAKMSGFGVYLAASTFVGFSSQALGIVLPFTFYTGLSSAISVALGPVGVAVAGIPILYEWLKAKPERLVGAIALIASWRMRLVEQMAPKKQAKWKSAFWTIPAAVVIVSTIYFFRLL